MKIYTLKDNKVVALYEKIWVLNSTISPANNEKQHVTIIHV